MVLNQNRPCEGIRRPNRFEFDESETESESERERERERGFVSFLFIVVLKNRHGDL
jgi:hypothetical protein